MIDIVRSQPGPEFLRTSKSKGRDRCGHEDVIRTLHTDFLAKCYLCERPLPQSLIRVDHRKHWNDFEDLRFEWTNLFPACDHCNGRRPNTYPEQGLLDPGAGHQLESRLHQRVLPGPTGEAYEFSATQPDDKAAQNTADELARVHALSGSTFRARKGAAELRSAILDRYRLDVEPCARNVRRLRRLRAKGEAIPQGELEASERKFRRLTSRRAPFTMLVRSLFGDLHDLFD